MTDVAYRFPVMPAASAPGARRKLRHPQFLLILGAVLGVFVVLITAITVLVRPTPQFCHFSCGPSVGPRLLSSSAYVSSAYGFHVEYNASYLHVANQSSTGVDLVVRGQNPQMMYLDYVATRGSNVSGALQHAIDGIDTNTIQDLREIGILPGAEIGEVAATGFVFQGIYVPSGGGQTAPVDVMVLAVAQNGLTISTLAVGPRDQRNGSAPFFLNPALAQLFDTSLSATVWPGQS